MTMQQLAERIDLDRVEAEAQRISIGRGLLTLIAGMFYVLGWLAGKVVLGVAATVTWSIAAAKIGWQDARRPTRARRVGAA
jgi:hypothetical protein